MALYGTFKYGTAKYGYQPIFKTDWAPLDYLNYGDLNRIERNTKYIAQYLAGLQYNIQIGTTKTGRDVTSIDLLSDINRIENNVEAIKTGFLIPPNYQGKKTWTIGMGFDYSDMNRLETNLSLLYKWKNIAIDNLIYCGTFDCGMQWEGGLY